MASRVESRFTDIIRGPALPDNSGSNHGKTGEGVVHYLRHVWKTRSFAREHGQEPNGKANLHSYALFLVWCVGRFAAKNPRGISTQCVVLIGVAYNYLKAY